jgi:hypothetical protein
MSLAREFLPKNDLVARVGVLEQKVAGFEEAHKKRVFVSSQNGNGNMGGLAGADATCQSEADAAQLTGTFKAWLSDSTASPATRFTHNPGWYVNYGDYPGYQNGAKIADNWADLESIL